MGRPPAPRDDLRLAEVLTHLDPTETVEAVPGGVAAWNELTRVMLPAGLVQATDVWALEQLAVSVARWREASRTLATDGFTVESVRGQAAHPALGAIRGAEASIARLLGRFGLTPSDRAALGLTVLKGRAAERGAWSDLDDDE